MLNNILRKIEKIIPRRIYIFFQPAYHYVLAFLGAVIYRFPGNELRVIAVTGTKGKTSTVEFINAILEEAGYKTAVAGTLRFKIVDDSKPNMYKMTMPGRFFMQRFLRKAVNAGCEYAILEISSEAARLHRNKFISLNSLVFTNIAPEHIESHGSYEKYLEAKLSIAKGLEKSKKSHKAIIVNIDDKEWHRFLDVEVPKKITYSIRNAENMSLSEDRTKFMYKGIEIESRMPGKFSVYNMLGAIKCAEFEDVDIEIIKTAIGKLKEIKGRAEQVKISPKQGFKVVIDYAHTPESLIAIYEAFSNSNKIAVIGTTGGGRDKWKRKDMAEVVERYCSQIILTDEDPYNDDPKEIVEDMARFFKNKKPEIIMDRREAIAKAISYAKTGDTILITGKGTDPYIMRAHGEKEKWSDAEVAKEELEKFLK